MLGDLAPSGGLPGIAEPSAAEDTTHTTNVAPLASAQKFLQGASAEPSLAALPTTEQPLPLPQTAASSAASLQLPLMPEQAAGGQRVAGEAGAAAGDLGMPEIASAQPAIQSAVPTRHKDIIKVCTQSRSVEFRI